MLDSFEATQARRQRRAAIWGTAAVVALFAAYGALLIARSSFVIEQKRYFCLFDDAMISLTYARNWADGHGLVWNVGETPVEGYTNFAWVVVMAAMHRVGLGGASACLAMQVVGLVLACTYLVGAARVAMVLRMGPVAVVLGCLLAAMFFPLTFFSVMGMEQSLLTVLVTFAVASAIRCLQDGRVRPAPFVLLAAGGLVRMDAVLCTAVLSLVLMFRCRRHAVLIMVYASLSVLPILAHMLWRHTYYGEWLPNTYFMKVYAWPLADRLWSGLRMSLGSTRRLFLPMLIVAVTFLHRPRAPLALILGTFATLMLYQIWVGGDSWPRDRFLTPIMPAMLVITAGALIDAVRKIRQLESRWRRVLLPPLVGLILVVPVASNQDTWREALLIKPPMFTEDNIKNLTRAFAIARATEEDALIGLYWAGSAPYFVARNYLDFLGKSDKVIAFMPVRKSELKMPPGHKKWSWKYVLEYRKPDVITRCDGQYLLHARRFQDNYLKVCPRDDRQEEITFWVRRDSNYLRWSEIRFTHDYDQHEPLKLDDPLGEAEPNLNPGH